MTPAYFTRVCPTYIENWSDALYPLSIPQIDIPLTTQETIALGTNLARLGSSFGTPALPINEIKKRIESALLHFPEGAFLRLGSRSGKDSPYAQDHGLKITNIYSGIRMLTEYSERIAFDLRLALRNKYKPHIFIRQWINIPIWAEFRCFMKNRALAGISQYDCKNIGHCQEISSNANRIYTAITTFHEKFKKISHLESVVFDVFIINQKSENKTPLQVKLLELNPYIENTDACLFDWNKRNDFDGSFRYL